MARSPLMNRLRRIVAMAAYQRGEAPPAMGRRAVLGGAGAMAALAARPRTVFASALKPRVAVVGAGLAGLTAAYELQKSGISAHVFDASTRLGGRCFSSRGDFAEGQIAEHGGEFIDTDHHEMRQLVRELGLHVDDVLAAQPAASAPIWYFNGAPYSDAQATSDFLAIYDIVQHQVNRAGSQTFYNTATPTALQIDAMSAADWITKYVPGGRTSSLGQLIEDAYIEEDAADAEAQSALVMIQGLVYSPKDAFTPYGYTDQRFHVRGGNDQVITSLAAALPGQIKTGRNLTAIVANDDGTIELTFQRDSGVVSHKYDRVILALPFAVMRQSVDFARAKFSTLKRLAINTLGMGASTKLQLQYTRRLWYDFGCNGELRLPATFQTTWDVTRAQPGELGVFNYWSGGSTAIAAGVGSGRSNATAASQGAELLLPGLTALWNGRYIINAWNKNPWSHGSYAFFAPGQTTAFHGVEPLPEGNCHFAGEHTSFSSQGFMNGGVESGMRAAAEIVASLA